MLLKQQKFDVVLTTKRSKIGYDERSGRFFEVQNSKDDTSSATLVDTPDAVSDLNENDMTATEDNNDNVVVAK